MKGRTVGVLVVLSAFALACGGGGRHGPPRPPPPGMGGGPGMSAPPPPMMPSTPPPPEVLSPDEAQGALSQKLDRYVAQCLNAFSPRIRQSRDRYLSWVDERTGPTGNEQNIYGLYTANFDPSQCVDIVDGNAGVQPSMPDVEAAGKDYADALKVLVPLIDEANRYYDDEDYKDDGMAKGKQMHPKLMDAWQKFTDADDRFSALVEGQEDMLDLQLLANPNPRAPEIALKVYVAAKPLARMAAVTRLGPDHRFGADLDVTLLKKRTDDLENAVAALQTYQKARMYGDSDDLESMSSACDDLVKDAKQFSRRAKDNEPFDDMDASWMGTSSGWMVDGSPDVVVSAYDSFIDDFNDIAKPKVQVPAGRKRGL